MHVYSGEAVVVAMGTTPPNKVGKHKYLRYVRSPYIVHVYILAGQIHVVSWHMIADVNFQQFDFGVWSRNEW